ncbi:hypothetical protein ACET8O_20140 [Aeromonas veronii]
MKGAELIRAASAAYHGRQAPELPAWLAGELMAAGIGGEPFPLDPPNRVMVAAQRCGRGQPIEGIPLTPRQRRIARGIAKTWQASQKNHLAA